MNSTKMAAEIGAAFSCADLGITPETRDDHAAYIASRLKVLKDDKRAFFTAASHAQKAADYLHGLQPQAASKPLAVTSFATRQRPRDSATRRRLPRSRLNMSSSTGLPSDISASSCSI